MTSPFLKERRTTAPWFHCRKGCATPSKRGCRDSSSADTSCGGGTGVVGGNPHPRLDGQEAGRGQPALDKAVGLLDLDRADPADGYRRHVLAVAEDRDLDVEPGCGVSRKPPGRLKLP